MCWKLIQSVGRRAVFTVHIFTISLLFSKHILLYIKILNCKAPRITLDCTRGSYATSDSSGDMSQSSKYTDPHAVPVNKFFCFFYFRPCAHCEECTLRNDCTCPCRHIVALSATVTLHCHPPSPPPHNFHHANALLEYYN